MIVEIKKKRDCPVFRKWLLEFIKSIAPDVPNVHLIHERRYSSFVTLELQWSDTVLQWRRDNVVKGFVVLSEQASRHIYITLMCSKEKGLGTAMLDYVRRHYTEHTYVIVRAVPDAAIFYAKYGFQVFDYVSFVEMGGYIDGCFDAQLSARVLTDCTETIRSELAKRHWLPCSEEDDEQDDNFIPMIILTARGEERQLTRRRTHRSR